MSISEQTGQAALLSFPKGQAGRPFHHFRTDGQAAPFITREGGRPPRLAGISHSLLQENRWQCLQYFRRFYDRSETAAERREG